MSVAWDRMLEATRAPLNNVSDPILSTNVYKDIETETDLETLDSLISDTLLAKRILDSLQNRVLSSDIKNSQEYSQEIEKVISWLNDFSDALGSQKLQLIIKDNNP